MMTTDIASDHMKYCELPSCDEGEGGGLPCEGWWIPFASLALCAVAECGRRAEGRWIPFSPQARMV